MELNKFITSQSGEVKRSEINLATYNPRKLSESAKKLLKANIKKIGIIGGLIWNRTTGNLLAGHQRITILDELNKYDGTENTDYLVRMDIVEMDIKTEMEQNIFLNNKNAQGEFDRQLLSIMIPDIDYELAGLDNYDLNMLGIEVMQPESSLSDIVNDFEQLNKPVQDNKDHIKELKKQIAAQNNDKVDNLESYFMCSFDTFASKAAFMQRFGFDPNDKFIKGEVFSNMIERID